MSALTTTDDRYQADARAVVAGDARALAASLLRRFRGPHRQPFEVFERAEQHAAEMSARRLSRKFGHRDLAGARVYADAWSLLHEREMTGIVRRQRDRARAALAAKDGAR